MRYISEIRRFKCPVLNKDFYVSQMCPGGIPDLEVFVGFYDKKNYKPVAVICDSYSSETGSCSLRDTNEKCICSEWKFFEESDKAGSSEKE